MKGKITKFRFYLDYDKEEYWVNEMCEQGWHLVKFGFGYFKFVKGLPGEYIYRSEMLTSLGKKDQSKEYIAFLEESGVELVSKFGVWAFFRKKTDGGSFELYSDISSKISYLNRILYLFLLLAIINYLNGFIQIFDVLNGESFFAHFIGIFNLVAAAIITFPILLLYKRRKALKSDLNIFHD